MKEYILIFIIALGISWILYRVLLKKEKILVFNRFYLLFTLVLCLIAPGLQLDPGNNMLGREFVNLESKENSAFPEVDDPEKISVQILENRSYFPKDFFFYIYILITAVLLLRFIVNLYHILRKISAAGDYSFDQLRVVPVKETGNSYSFFNYVFTNAEDLKKGKVSETIIAHERVHSRQLHSADILLVEFLSCIFWINPFIWLYKKDIIENHEYLADAGVVETGIDPAIYAMELIQAGNKYPQALNSGFSFIQTKNRLNMLHMKKSSGFTTTIKIAVVLALFAAVFTISSFTGPASSTPFIVVVDAGHGGKDPGNKNEKEINLMVAKQLAALSSQELKIILVRNSDEFLDFANRKKFIKAQNANLLLSLHCNASGESTKNGVEVFHLREGDFKQQSYEISKVLVEEQLQAITNKGEIKMANFKILQDLPHPAVLMEMGFLSNPKDAARLEDPAHQKFIAQNIYNALLKVKNKK